MRRGRLDEAELLLAQAVALGEQLDGSNQLELIPRLTTQIELFWRQGKYACAGALSSRVLVLEEQYLEPADVQIAFTLNLLALIYVDQGKYLQAEPLFQRSSRTTPDEKEGWESCSLLKVTSSWREGDQQYTV